MKYIDCKTQQELDAALAADQCPNLVGSGKFEVRGYSQVRACDSSQVRAYGYSQVTACGSSQVRAYGYSQVRAYDSSQVMACGSSQVMACGYSQVTACDSSQVRAYGSSQVRACDSSQVRACGSSQVRACGSCIAITKHSARAKIKGGKVVDATKSPKSIQEWCHRYGVKISRGIVVLYKAVDNNFASPKGGIYTPGTTPEAKDWDGGKAECGGGLHFSPFPAMALNFNKEATKFVGCPIRVKEIAVHKNASMPEKVKARRCCKPVFEVDIDGTRI